MSEAIQLTFDPDFPFDAPTSSTFSPKHFDFHSLFTSTEPFPFIYRSNLSSLAILGDSLTILKQIKSNSINLIFSDAPYNIGKDFGNNQDKWPSTADYINWCKIWLDECMRILTKNGTLYFMTATQYMPYLDVYMSEKYNVLCRIIWNYDSSGVQSKKIFGSLYEPILMVTKSSSASYTFNASQILVPAKTGAQRKLIDYRKDPPAPYSSEKIPGNVWNFNRVRFKMDEYENHPTQKPEALLERIIKASSNPGDIVLDPFSGSFTTSAVASRLGRISVGIDINEEYFEIGLRRVGISSEYNGKQLVKEKKEKTTAKSKHVRGILLQISETFIREILVQHFPDNYQTIYDQSLLIQYLDYKTKAIHRNSKSRRSFANIYAVYSILHYYQHDFYQNADAYRLFSGYDFTTLLNFCRSLYGGSKLQNHALNSRASFEFRNKFPHALNDLIISNNGKYLIHIDYLYVGTIDISRICCEIIERYIELIIAKDQELTQILENLHALTNVTDKKNMLCKLLTEDTEARIFEVISYAILKNHYKAVQVYFGYSPDSLNVESLHLYRTGRTNANDGGIDFVMRPLGRFFQVTEVHNYDKYLLDIDKVLHFPVTFVIKTHTPKDIIIQELNQYITQRSGGMLVIEERYRKAIEEVITINELLLWINELSSTDLDALIHDIDVCYHIELNLPLPDSIS